MGSRPRLTIALAAILVAGAAIAVLGRGTFASFSAQASNDNAGLTADADWTAPTASAAVVAKSAGGDAGYIRDGGTYHIYANVTDGGSPASGVASVSAEAGMDPVPLGSAGGPWTVDGVSYNFRSSQQTLTGLATGVHPFSISSTDSDRPANSQTQSGFSVVVDNTAASAADVQTANGGSIAGRPEQGDTITFTYSEPIERLSILPGWTGAAANMVVRVNNSGAGDRVQVYNAANTALLPLTNGTGLNLNRTDYVNTNRTFGATGTPSTMVRSGNSITITLGTQSGPGTTAGGNGTMAWTPSASPTDRAGNPTSTTARNETGTADREF